MVHRYVYFAAPLRVPNFKRRVRIRQPSNPWRKDRIGWPFRIRWNFRSKIGDKLLFAIVSFLTVGENFFLYPGEERITRQFQRIRKRQLITAITRSGERGQTGGETLRKANKLNTFARACLIAARYLLGKCTPRRAPALKLLGF